MTKSPILISGIGIAGPTLAYWLRHFGFSPTLVEVATTLRTGGYVIDFWGLGYDIAERMRLLSEINRVGYHVRELRTVNDRGQRLSGFGTSVFNELTGGRFVSIARSDLSRLIFGKIENSAEFMFGDQIVSLHEEAEGVRVNFEHAGPAQVDLVIGADGLHSIVRKLVFGPQDRFENILAIRWLPSRSLAIDRETKQSM